jgi:hypothetical protein
MIAKDSLHFDLTATGFSASVPSAVLSWRLSSTLTDLVLI